MSYVGIWIHLVFSTKYREPVLTKEIRIKLFNHVWKYTKEKSIIMLAVNGYTDHVHVLVSLKRDQSICQLAQLIKGESSHWINKQGLLPVIFRWQENYFAKSVGDTEIKRILRYIKNQEQHHMTKSFGEEVEISFENEEKDDVFMM